MLLGIHLSCYCIRMDDDSYVTKCIEIVPLERNENSSNVADSLISSVNLNQSV